MFGSEKYYAQYKYIMIDSTIDNTCNLLTKRRILLKDSEIYTGFTFYKFIYKNKQYLFFKLDNFFPTNGKPRTTKYVYRDSTTGVDDYINKNVDYVEWELLIDDNINELMIQEENTKDKLTSYNKYLRTGNELFITEKKEA